MQGKTKGLLAKDPATNLTGNAKFYQAAHLHTHLCDSR